MLDHWPQKGIVFRKCVVTETWMNSESYLCQDDGLDLDLGEGISFFHCGRVVGRRGGGVVFFQKFKDKVC